MTILCIPSFSNSQGAADNNTIEDIIQNKKPKSVEELLSLLPTEMKSNFTLAYKSRSLQDSSPQSPRAILFSKYGDTIIAFNGDPKQAGYDSVELMKFSGPPNHRTTQLKEISFDPTHSKNAQISEANPNKCTSCHGMPVTPIWASYPIWNGFYGGYDDRPMNKKNPNLKDGVVYGLDVDRGEEKNLENFKKISGKNSRYQNLIWKGSKNYPYLTENEDFNPANLHEEHRPNLRMTTNLTLQAGRSLASQIENSPYYNDFKYSFLSENVCHDIKNDIYTENQLDKALAKSGVASGSDFSTKGKLLKLFGVSQNQLNLLKSGDPENSFDSGTRGTESPLQVAVVSLLSNELSDADKANFFVDSPYPDKDFAPPKIINDSSSDELCASLRKKIPSAISNNSNCASCDLRAAPLTLVDAPVNPNALVPITRASTTTVPDVVQKCIICHDNGANGLPSIPFSSKNLMKSKLSESHGSSTFADYLKKRVNSGEMPPDGTKLSPTEKTSLFNYLDGIIDY
jgi:hypothetical protein